MLAWSEGTDSGRQKTRNHGYDVIVGGGLFTDYSDHPHKLVTLNQNSNQQAPGLWLLSRWWDAYRKQLGLKGSPKSRDAVALQQIKERWRFAYDWSWWYPSGNRPLQQYLGFTAGRAGYGQFEHGLTAWLQNSKKRAERSERLMYEAVPRYLHNHLSASSMPVMGW